MRRTARCSFAYFKCIPRWYGACTCAAVHSNFRSWSLPLAAANMMEGRIMYNCPCKAPIKARRSQARLTWAARPGSLVVSVSPMFFGEGVQPTQASGRLPDRELPGLRREGCVPGGGAQCCAKSEESIEVRCFESDCPFARTPAYRSCLQASPSNHPSTKKTSAC